MKDVGSRGISDHSVVSHDEWLEARMNLLEKEKEFTRLQDELNRTKSALEARKTSTPPSQRSFSAGRAR